MVKFKNNIILLIFTVMLSSCIEPFSLDLDIHDIGKYVVYGQITDKEGYQTVSISMASSIGEPNYNPLTNCDVKIIDTLGNVFIMNDIGKGVYRVWMEKKNLTPGNSYQVDIITPSGVEIISDFDQMQECPEIDSIYYIRKDIPTTNPEEPLHGIQFYADLDGKNTNSHYYRFDMVETWEHHAPYPMTWVWNKISLVKIYPPDYSRYYCWSTLPINYIYTLSTENLTQNKYSMFELHFVSNLTQRLTYCYSLLINQLAISKPAFNYWEKLRINSSEHGGLYDTQPLRVKGNLRSTTNPELEVLGFFGAATVRSKRIFVQNVQNLELYYPPCDPRPIQTGDLTKKKSQYLIDVGSFALMIIEDACVECDMYPGKTVKPDYWPY